jgi:hypothetical protein
MLAPTEVAAFRREVELILIEENPGITNMDAVRTLSALKWFPSNFNQDTFKTDVSSLQWHNLVGRNPASRGRVIGAEKEAIPKR